VVFPLRSPLISSKLCPIFILATWLLTIAIYSPILFFIELGEVQGKLVCTISWKEGTGDSFFRNYFLTLSVVLFYIPFTLIVILYSIIAVTLKSKRIPGDQNANAEVQHAKRHKKVLNMAIAIASGFAFCWLPRNICFSDFVWC